jgi:hypothetical protein
VQSPTTKYKHQQKNKAEQANATARLTPPKDRAVFGVAVSFLCHGFCSRHTLQHIYFFKRQKKIKELQATTRSKNPRQKNCLKLH